MKTFKDLSFAPLTAYGKDGNHPEMACIHFGDGIMACVTKGTAGTFSISVNVGTTDSEGQVCGLNEKEVEIGLIDIQEGNHVKWIECDDGAALCDVVGPDTEWQDYCYNEDQKEIASMSD